MILNTHCKEIYNTMKYNKYIKKKLKHEKIFILLVRAGKMFKAVRGLGHPCF